MSVSYFLPPEESNQRREAEIETHELELPSPQAGNFGEYRE